MGHYPILFFIVVAVVSIPLFAAVLWYQHHLAKIRREDLQNLATDLGLDFEADDTSGRGSPFQEFPLFKSGHSRRSQNFVFGNTQFARVTLFDYKYITGSGKHCRTHRQTVVGIESEKLTEPEFNLSPESVLHWFATIFGQQDIDFEDHPEFSKSFVLRSSDEALVHELFDRSLLDFFALQSGISCSVGPKAMIFFRRGKFLKPEQWKELMGEGFTIYTEIHKRMTTIHR